MPSSEVLKEDEEFSFELDQLSPLSIHLRVDPSLPVNKAYPHEVTASAMATFETTKPISQVFAIDSEALAATLGDDVPSRCRRLSSDYRLQLVHREAD